MLRFSKHSQSRDAPATVKCRACLRRRRATGIGARRGRGTRGDARGGEPAAARARSAFGHRAHAAARARPRADRPGPHVARRDRAPPARDRAGGRARASGPARRAGDGRAVVRLALADAAARVVHRARTGDRGAHRREPGARRPRARPVRPGDPRRARRLSGCRVGAAVPARVRARGEPRRRAAVEAPQPHDRLVARPAAPRGELRLLARLDRGGRRDRRRRRARALLQPHDAGARRRMRRPGRRAGAAVPRRPRTRARRACDRRSAPFRARDRHLPRVAAARRAYAVARGRRVSRLADRGGARRGREGRSARGKPARRARR